MKEKKLFFAKSIMELYFALNFIYIFFLLYGHSLVRKLFKCKKQIL